MKNEWKYFCINGLARHRWDKEKEITKAETGFRGYVKIISIVLPACKCGAVKLNGKTFIPQGKSVAKNTVTKNDKLHR